MRPRLHRLLVRCVAGFWAVCLPVACYREVSDADPAMHYARYTGTAPWEVDGVRPGQSLDEIKRLLGEPSRSLGSPARPILQWQNSAQTLVTFDAAHRATEVLGGTVTAGGKTLTYSNLDAATLRQILGPGTAHDHYRAKGSGVIALGVERTGTTLTYRNGDCTFELTVGPGGTGYVRATKTP